jgi:cyclophilin family peptidyl-prolyl cis-trans isomerase
MARSADPNSAGSQFFIMLGVSPHLDNQYTVFGKVIEGMEVVDQIRARDAMTKVTVTET